MTGQEPITTDRLRGIAVGLLAAVLAAAPAGAVFAQDQLPAAEDDLAFARKLLAADLPDLAVDIIQRLEGEEGLDNAKKQELGLMVVDAYSALARRSPDKETRERCLAMAERKLNALVAELGDDILTPDMRYRQATITQTEARSISASLDQIPDEERKKTLRSKAAELFEDCRKKFDEIAAKAKEKRDKLIADNLGANQKAIEEMQATIERSELQAAWSVYYKAEMYPPEDDAFRKDMADAAAVFGKFVEEYPNKLTMLFARYGRGLAYKALGRSEEAQEDFKKVIELIEGERNPPELLPHKANNQVQLAEVLAAQGRFDEAVAILDAAMDGNAAIKDDPRQSAQVRYTKGMILGQKAEKMKKAGETGYSDVYAQAIEALQSVVAEGRWYAREAAGLIAQYVEASGRIANLGLAARLALAESLLRQKDYDRALKELRAIVSVVDPKKEPETGFRAHLYLADTLRQTGKFDEAIREYEALLTAYKGSIGKEKLADAMLQQAWAYGMRARAHRGKTEYDEAYLKALERLAAEYPETQEGADAQYYYSEALRQRAGNSSKKLAEVAEAYAGVKTASKYYWKSRYLEGLCYYNAYKLHPGKPEEKPAEAKKCLETARGKLVSVVDNMDQADAGDDWPILAAQTLADLYVETAQPAKAEELVDEIIRKYPQLTKGSPDFLGVQLRIFINLGKLAKAEGVVEELATKDVDAAVLMRGYLMLGDAWEKRGKELVKANKDSEALEASKKAGELFAKSLPHVAKDDMKALQLVAGRCYNLGAYKTAIEAVGRIDAIYKESGLPADGLLWGLRIVKIRCYQRMGEWPASAAKELEELEQRFPNDSTIKVLRAKTLQDQGRHDEALKIWEDVDKGTSPPKDDWYNAKYNRAWIYVQKGMKEEARAIIEHVMALAPPTNVELKQKFQELLKQAR